MSDNTPIHRYFHPLIADAYTGLHQWIETKVQDANGYKRIPYSNLKQKLQETDWKHIAFQYYAFFPAHYFKAAHTLDIIVGEDQLVSWLRHRQKVCVLGVGCRLRSWSWLGCFLGSSYPAKGTRKTCK